MEDIKLLECKKCGNVVLSMCGCDECLKCCGEVLSEVNTEGKEKSNTHEPSYYRQDNKVIIRVNHEQMSDHYIKAIVIKTDKEALIHKFSYEEEPEIIMGYEQNMEVYSICSKDGVYKTVIE